MFFYSLDGFSRTYQWVSASDTRVDIVRTRRTHGVRGSLCL